MSAPAISVPGLIEAPVDPYRVPRGYGDQMRPGVVPPGETKQVWYSRVTSFVDDLDDKEGVTKWREAHVLLGALRRPEALVKAAQGFAPYRGEDCDQDYYRIKAHEPTPEELEQQIEPIRRLLWKTIDELKVAAGVDQASLYGTLFHAVSQCFDEARLGDCSPEEAVARCDWAFDEYAAKMRPCREVDLDAVRAKVLTDLHAYAIATADLEIVEIERFGANADLRVGGTWDRIVHFQGLNFMLDIKTGRSATEHPAKLAMQLATYVHCTPYNPVDGWTPRPFEVNQTWALVVALPGDGTCEVRWVKIARAWRTVSDLITAARAWRSYATPKKLLVPFDGETVPVIESVEESPAHGHPTVAAIRTCTTPDAVRALWHADYDAGNRWPDWLSEIAAAHVAELTVTALAGAVRVDEAA